jgi:YgiT-type zinc finger domain-containing protein
VEDSNGKESLMEPYGDCVYCGGEVVERRQRVDYRVHGQLYILENVPTGTCQQCGEQFFTAEVAHRMESVVSGASGPFETIPIPVIAVK